MSRKKKNRSNDRNTIHFLENNQMKKDMYRSILRSADDGIQATDDYRLDEQDTDFSSYNKSTINQRDAVSPPSFKVKMQDLLKERWMEIIFTVFVGILVTFIIDFTKNITEVKDQLKTMESKHDNLAAQNEKVINHLNDAKTAQEIIKQQLNELGKDLDRLIK